MESLETLGTRLKKLRENKGLTQKEAAKKFGITNFQLSRYESDTSNPDPDLIAKFAIEYEVATDYLLGVSGDKEPLYRKAGVSDSDYNNLSAYQKKVVDFFVSREKLAFKNQPENILDALEEFEIFYEYWMKKQEDNKNK